MKTSSAQKFVLFTLAAATFFTVACGSQSDAAEASRNLASSIVQSNHQDTNPAPQGAAIDENRLYLDASISMKGFVNPQNHSSFDQVIDGIGDVLPGCKVFKYGQSGSEPPAKVSDLITPVGFGRELHEHNFYSLRFNPDDRLIDKLTSESRQVLSVLLTDGVYSEPAGSTSPPVVNAMQRWLEKGYSLGLFMFKSNFDGELYSERSRSMSKLKVSVKGRPFYAFVFSPTNEALIDIEEKLKSRFPSMQALRFGNDAVECESTWTEPLEGIYSYRKPPTSPYRWHMLDSGTFAGGNVLPIRYSVKCTIAPHYPVASLSFALTPEYYRWQNGTFQKAETLPAGYKSAITTKEVTAGATQVAHTSGDSSPITTEFEVQFPKDTSTRFSFYYLKFTSSIKELKADFSGMSTRDDRELGQANRTYRFRELVSAIADVHFKTRLASRTSTAVFATLDNK